MKFKRFSGIILAGVMVCANSNVVLGEWELNESLTWSVDDGEPYVDTETGDMLFFSTERGAIVGMQTSDTTYVEFPSEIDGVSVVGIESISGYGINNYHPKNNIVKAIIPEGVTYLGEDAFFASVDLISVVLPESLISIGAGAFDDCGLTSIEIPSGITAIEDETFSYCIDLADINIPNGVLSIGSLAFDYCIGLKTVTIPNSVVSIAEDAFSDCKSIETVYCYKGSAADDINLYADSENVNIVYLDGSTLTETTEAATEVTTEAAENIYTDNDIDLSFDTSELDGVTDSDSANALMESVVSGMSSAEIGSVKAKDQLAYLAEEAAARAATIEAEGDIVIDQENTEDALSTVSAVVDSAESIISSSDVGVKSVRSKVRYSTSKNSSVSISKENITADVDVVEAVTPFGSFEFEPDSVSELTVDSDGTNKISVSFNKTDSTSKVTVKFPNVTSDGYKAVVDEDGNVIGGKYNPITDELSAKIEESGVFTVVTNEKDFSDIKSQPAEVQAAIKKLASKGIIKGTSETEFSPDSPITRAEIAALIVRILDADDPNADGGFSDVTKENWYFGSAGSSKRENIIAGYEDNTFRGTVVIPKVQITSVTARVLTNRLGYYSASESVLNEFTDADTIASWARSDVALAAYANMVIRRTDGSFEPNMEMTRGDAAVILEKLFDKVW